MPNAANRTPDVQGGHCDGIPVQCKGTQGIQWGLTAQPSQVVGRLLTIFFSSWEGCIVSLLEDQEELKAFWSQYPAEVTTIDV